MKRYWNQEYVAKMGERKLHLATSSYNSLEYIEVDNIW
jgi:hypothetical protein